MLTTMKEHIGDMYLTTRFTYKGKNWRSLLAIYQEQLKDLFYAEPEVNVADAYEVDQKFWNHLSEKAAELHLQYLELQNIPSDSSIRRVAYRWLYSSKLRAAHADFSDNKEVHLNIQHIPGF
jgi:hypothetical protein